VTTCARTHTHTEQLWKQNLGLHITLYFATSNFTTGCVKYRQVSCYARVIFLKNVVQTEITDIKHKIPIFKTVYFMRVWGLATAS